MVSLDAGTVEVMRAHVLREQSSGVADVFAMAVDGWAQLGTCISEAHGSLVRTAE